MEVVTNLFMHDMLCLGSGDDVPWQVRRFTNWLTVFFAVNRRVQVSSQSGKEDVLFLFVFTVLMFLSLLSLLFVFRSTGNTWK